MTKISDVGLGEKYPCNHLNSREIYPGYLLRGGFFDPIRMDIFSTRDERHRIRVCGSEEATLGNLFALSFLWKIEISPTHCRNLKYDDDQEIRPRPTGPGDISQQEIPKFATC